MKLLAALLVCSLAMPTRAKTPPPPTVPATIAAPLVDDPMGVTIHRLANGLTVYLSPNKGQPRITAHIAVRTGSKNDPVDAESLRSVTTAISLSPQYSRALP